MGALIALEMAAVLMGGFRLGTRRSAGPPVPTARNTLELGKLLYTQYLYPLEIAAVILLVAIVAAIALTLRRRKDSKYVDPADQVKRQGARPPAHRQDAVRRRAAEPAAATRSARSGNQGMTLTLGTLPFLGAMLFALSVVGIFLNRKNIIVLLMAMELMLLAVNMNFVAFSHFLGDTHGQIFVFFILTVAAAESAIGLAMLVCCSATATRSTSTSSTRSRAERRHTHGATSTTPAGRTAGAAGRRGHRRPLRHHSATTAAGRHMRHHPRRAGRPSSSRP